MSYKGYKVKEEVKKKISNTLKKMGGNQTSWKKGQKAWNFEHGKKLKRKMKKWNGKLVLNSHYVFCKAIGIDKIPKGFVIHHQDHNSLNDDINNLILMTDKAHRYYHIRISKLKAGDKFA